MNILDSYPVFENNQVLTSDQLNNLVKYLDQQNRLTRAQLIGIGAICGFNLKFIPKSGSQDNTLLISKGIGITSEGFLIAQSDCYTTRYRSYKLPKTVGDDPFTDKKTNKNIVLDELLSTDADISNDPEIKTFDKAFLKDKVVLLFLEIFDQDLKTCLAKSCDEIGQTRIFTIRKLLIATKDMDEVLQRLNIGSYDPTYPNKFELPVITIPRVNIKSDEPAAKDKSLLLKNYLDAVGMVKKDLLDAIKLTYTTYNPILKDVYAKDYFGNGGIIDTKVLEWDTFLNVDYYGTQYFYDFIKDLALAYDEFKNTTFELCNECLINTERFPFHLMLGIAIPDEDYNIDSTPYRNRFIHSPAYSIQKYLTLKARSLHQRMVSMIINFNFEYIQKSEDPNIPKNPKAKRKKTIDEIYIIPSYEKLSKLSERSIPFYYDIDEDDLPLINYWNYDIEKRKLSDYILSYHHQKSTYPLEVKNALKYDIDKFSFLRIEGLLGKEVETIKTTLEKQKKDYNLSFKIVSLQVNPSDDSLILDPCLWCDLQVLYFHARLAYLDIFQKLINDIKEIKSYSFPLKFTSIDVDVAQKLIDETIKYLTEKINDFIFQGFFKNYCLLLELLQEYRLNILHYQGRLIHELINVTSKEDFQTGIIQINLSLSFIQKILGFGVYKELYLLFIRLENRKKYLKENHLSVFSNFLNTNPGMNHEGGVKDDGTLVLVSELDVKDNKYKVFADFTLPYLCCCDCNDIPCEEKEINYNQLPYLALPDGVICEINCPVEIQVLNNDYILYGDDLDLSSDNQYVKCDPQSKIITYKRDDNFTGLDIFAYSLDRKIVKAVDVEQPITVKKKKGYFDVPADTQEVISASANVKVLIHNKFELHVQAFEDTEIVAQHDQILIDVLQNDITYKTTELSISPSDSTTKLGGQASVVDDGMGKKVIKFIPNNAGKDSFNYQLTDNARGNETSKATVTVFVTKFDLTVPDIVYLVTSVNQNGISIVLPQGWSISTVSRLPVGMGSMAIDQQNSALIFTPGSSFTNNKTLTTSYILRNDKNEPVKGILHLISGLDEYSIPDIVYRVTKKIGNSIPIEFASQNGIPIAKVEDLPANYGTAKAQKNNTINFVPGADFTSINTLKINYYLKKESSPEIKGVIHLVNGLVDYPIPDIIYQVTQLGTNIIPIDYALRNKLEITDIISDIPPEIGTLTNNKQTIIFETGPNYSTQNSLRFSYTISKDGETVIGNVHLINSLKQSEEYKDYFSEVMAGTVMAFAYDPINSYDVVLTSLGRDYSKVIDVIISITGRKPEDINALVATLPATIIKETTLANATNIAKQLTEYGATVETPDWLKQHGWLICDGKQYNRFEYSRLFDRIKILYGQGDGKYTFNVPDYRNQFLRGWDNNEKNPRRVSTSQADQIQSHKHLDSGHTHTDKGHYHSEYVVSNSGLGTAAKGIEVLGIPVYQANNQSYNTGWGYAGIDSGYASLGEPALSNTIAGEPRHGAETRPRNIGVIFCIKF